jgi:uncharacterized protein
MMVDLRQLRAEQGATLVVTCDEPVSSQIADVPFVEPVEGELTLTNLGVVLRVTGQLGTQVELVCDRCARPFRHRLQVTVREELDWGGADGFIYTDGQAVGLDVTALAREELVLALPMSARCRHDCEGLCDRCGADLRDGTCQCGPQTPDPRLAPLAALRDIVDQGRHE